MSCFTRIAWGRAFALAAVALVLSSGSTQAAGKVAKLDAPALARIIDQSIQAKLAAEKVTGSPQTDDAEFLRRLYLDITAPSHRLKR